MELENSLLDCRFSRVRSARSLSVLSLTFVFFLLSASATHAEIREYRIEFIPSSSPNVAGHLLHVGTASGAYGTTFDMGSPPASGGSLVYTADFEDSVDLFAAMRTYDGQGNVSGYSNELRVAAVVPPPNDPPPSDGGDDDSPPPSGSGDDDPFAGLDPAEIVLGLTSTRLGIMGQLLAAGQGVRLTFDSHSSRGDFRPARCDLDGDGDQDLVLGFDDQGAGVLAVLIIENHRVFETRSIVSGTSSYRNNAGMTYPACGDLDGDGRAEIAIGFGPEMEGYVQVLDDMSTDFEPIQSSRSSSNGMIDITTIPPYDVSLFPAIGDIDGDGVDELVVGSSAGSRVGIVLLDDRASDFAPHPSTESSRGQIEPMPRGSFSSANDVTRRPAVGDVDGDGWDEIVVGFGSGAGGQIMILDDASTTYPRDGRASDQTIVAGRDEYRSTDGSTVVALGDIDRDGRAEIVVGFSRAVVGELQIFDDQTAGYAPLLRPGGFLYFEGGSWAVVPSPEDLR